MKRGKRQADIGEDEQQSYLPDGASKRRADIGEDEQHSYLPDGASEGVTKNARTVVQKTSDKQLQPPKQKDGATDNGTVRNKVADRSPPQRIPQQELLDPEVKIDDAQGTQTIHSDHQPGSNRRSARTRKPIQRLIEIMTAEISTATATTNGQVYGEDILSIDTVHK